MLARLHVQNLRVLRSLDCTLDRLTCLVGPNGCGKSTLLAALSWGTFRTNRSMFSLPEGCQLQAEFVAPSSLSPARRVQLSLSVVQRGDNLGTNISWVVLGTGEPEPIPSEAALQMEEIPFLCLAPRFVPETLQRHTPINQKRDILSETGDGLAGLLADWKLEDDPRLTRVIEQLGKVVPQVREIRTRRTERGEYALWFGVGPQRKAVPAHEMSSGTLYTLALLTLLESVEERSALILLDDLDRDLHPEAQGILLGHLRAVLEFRPGLQIVATSHSPYLVDHFLASEVRVMALDDDGFARIAPLTSHPDYTRLGSAMRPGEFWSAAGERWILRSTPEKAA